MSVMEEYVKQHAKNELRNTAKILLKEGVSVEIVVKACGKLSRKEIEDLANEVTGIMEEGAIAPSEAFRG